MTANIEVFCDICRKRIEIKTANGHKPHGFALQWSPKAGEFHEFELTSRWIDSPVHLCGGCILAISRLASRLDAKGQL